jgi:hypothetical protein
MGRPKQAQVKEVFPVRLPDDRRRALQAEAETRGGNASDVIRLHLERYSEMAWRDLPKLRDADWCTVFEALGSVPVDVAAVAWVGMAVARSLEETELARKWKVDAGQLASSQDPMYAQMRGRHPVGLAGSPGFRSGRLPGRPPPLVRRSRCRAPLYQLAFITCGNPSDSACRRFGTVGRYLALAS